jgi:hypothetical protein
MFIATSGVPQRSRSFRSETRQRNDCLKLAKAVPLLRSLGIKKRAAKL